MEGDTNVVDQAPVAQPAVEVATPEVSDINVQDVISAPIFSDNSFVGKKIARKLIVSESEDIDLNGNVVVKVTDSDGTTYFVNDETLIED